MAAYILNRSSLKILGDLSLFEIPGFIPGQHFPTLRRNFGGQYLINCNLQFFCSLHSIEQGKCLVPGLGLGLNRFRQLSSMGEIAVNTPVDNCDNISSTDISKIKSNEEGILEPNHEDVSDIAPFVCPSFNLAAYANQSPTIQEFVKLNVKLHKIEQIKGAAECILKLDFEKHVQPYLRFLHDVGVPAEEFGYFVTKNPFIFEQALDDLQVRVNYLEAKQFSKSAISNIITKNPKWLSFSTVEIDKRLGFFQRTFMLSGDEVRYLAELRPRIITYDLGKISVSHFAVKEDLGFTEIEAKTLLLKKPKIYDIQTKALKLRFDYVHNIMEIPHEQILQQPNILLFRAHITQQRHEFLKALGKAQFDPKLPGYVSLDSLVFGTDVEFCRDVAKTSINVFNAFLKTK